MQIRQNYNFFDLFCFSGNSSCCQQCSRLSVRKFPKSQSGFGQRPAGTPTFTGSGHFQFIWCGCECCDFKWQRHTAKRCGQEKRGNRRRAWRQFTAILSVSVFVYSYSFLCDVVNPIFPILSVSVFVYGSSFSMLSF